ncbi:MAG TPA: methyltransferase domain-containing protein [Myxococcaceae bacterium]|nr:methyltransferase domain-containing protein [Myxococcaceae bacterium]
MSPAEPFPLYFPDTARRPFSSEAVTRRFAKVAQLEEGGRVLSLGCGPSGSCCVVLAQEFGCSVVAADSDEAMLASLQERVRLLGLQGRVEVRRVEPSQPGLPEGEFDAVLCQSRILLPFPEALRSFRPLLGRDGRVGLTYPVRVGRVVPRAVLDFWERRLGLPLPSPHELLSLLSQSGFEPESVESLQDAELDLLYGELAPQLEKAPPERASFLREEMALHHEQNGKASSSYAFVIARRKEDGERPPASRDRG